MGKEESLSNYSDHQQSARDIVLRKCGQTKPLPFNECYPDSILSKCRKIGDGAFAEVFLLSNQDGRETVMKVMPIEGDLTTNGKPQKKFHEILSEVVIAMELSKLRDNKKNKTSTFSQIMKVRCVQGCYPIKLIQLWDMYPRKRNHGKRFPEVFSSEQLYIVLELANGGSDLATFNFKNVAQAYSIFKQTACALAIAEKQLEFEHRDLHCCNILVTPVKKNRKLKFRLNKNRIEISSKGVEVSIIDFTFSRIMFEDMVFYSDLSLESDLFASTRGYQFSIYRSMLWINQNRWKDFQPYSNILWLHYIIEKLLDRITFGDAVISKFDRGNFVTLSRLRSEVLLYKSAQQFVKEKLMHKKFSLSTCL